MDVTGKHQVNNLTGLQSFEDLCREAESLLKKHPGDWCLVSIDIDNFKIFNDWFGWEKGDLVLKKMGILLEYLARQVHGLCSYNGMDNFAMLLPDRESLFQQVYDVARSVISSYGNTISFQPLLGIARIGKGDSIDTTLYDKCLIAADQGKGNYRQRIWVYDPSLVEDAETEYQILNDFQQALMQQEITFDLQPQCRVSTGKVVGFEALARWRRKDGTSVSPSVFIPVLEKMGFVTELDTVIWRSVCRWLRSLMDRGIDPLPVSINVSKVDLYNLDVAGYLYGLISEYRIPLQLLKVEITESAYAEDFSKIDEMIREIRERGFNVFMDDFGSGYSSLNMLNQVQVDAIKLDMDFMNFDQQKRRGLHIIESIINMTKTMNLPIIVEGVETEDMAIFLHDMGCRYIQGYYFYKPMRVEEAEPILMNLDRVDHRGIYAKRNEQYHVREFLDETVFTDSVLNNILGPVAFYSLEGKDLTIVRFNEQFYRAISDSRMEERQNAIQHYVVKEDWPRLYKMLDDAVKDPLRGGQCTVRFYKSFGGMYWYSMRLFYLREDQGKKIFYGRVQDLTVVKHQTQLFLNEMNRKSRFSLRLNLTNKMVQRLPDNDRNLETDDMPAMDLETSLSRTIAARIVDPEEQEKFRNFFLPERLISAYKSGIYDESMLVHFAFAPGAEPMPMKFSAYFVQDSPLQDLYVYVFAFDREDNQ